MNRLRAAVALLFQVLLLQVNVLGGGMACAPGWLQSVAAPTSAHAMHGAQAMHGAPDGGEHGPTSQHDTVPSHCATAVGCAAIAVAAPEMLVAPLAIGEPSVTTIRVAAPRWMHPAPEPPPPRA
jgi:hypothetical protein